MEKKSGRKYPRIRVDFTVEVREGAQSARMRALTMGGGGLFLATSEPPTCGTELSLFFRPARHLPVLEAKSRVCYVVPDKGAAVQFTEISAENHRLILRLLHRRTGDKRKYPRAALAAQVQYKETTSLALARDVSAGGMFIETKSPLPPGSRINLRFNLDASDPVVLTVAEVTYGIAQLGMGVQFVNLSPQDKLRIESYITTPAAPASATPQTK